MKWHIESVLAAVKFVVELLEKLLAAEPDAQRAKPFASLLTQVRGVQAEVERLSAEPSSDGVKRPIAEGLDEEEDTLSEAPPRA